MTISTLTMLVGVGLDDFDAAMESFHQKQYIPISSMIECGELALANMQICNCRIACNSTSGAIPQPKTKTVKLIEAAILRECAILQKLLNAKYTQLRKKS